MSILLASGRATFETSEKMNKKYVKHGIAFGSTKSQKPNVTYYSRLEGYFSGWFRENLEKMRKNNAKHGIASVSTKSKLAYYLRLEG